MSKYDDPGPGHSQAVRQLAESRGEVLQRIRQLNSSAVGEPGPHENLVPLTAAPTVRTVAMADLSDYLLQLRPYRATTDSWQMELGTMQLPERFTEEKPGVGRGRRHFDIERRPQVALMSLDDVMELAGHTVRYTAPKVGKGNAGHEVREYLFALTPQQIRRVFAAADEIAEEGGFLAERTEPDTEDTAGW